MDLWYRPEEQPSLFQPAWDFFLDYHPQIIFGMVIMFMLWQVYDKKFRIKNIPDDKEMQLVETYLDLVQAGKIEYKTRR